MKPQPVVNISITPRRLLLGILLLSAVAWAANTTIDWGNRLIKGTLEVVGVTTLRGVTLGQVDAGSLIVAGDAGIGGLLSVNGFTFSPRGRGSVAFDFPAMSGQNEVATSVVCAVTSAIDAGGCAFGDQLLMGIDQAPSSAFISFTPRLTAAGIAEVQGCCNGINDAGSCDMPDATYTVTCVR